MHDVVIVGAGVAGAAMARELARYALDVLVLEAGYDLACGASRTNSGIVHGGYDPEPGSLKARYNVAGARMFATLAREIGFRYQQTGSMVVARSAEEVAILRELVRRAQANGVQGVALIGSERAYELEPALAPGIQAALLCEESGICDPFGLVVALAECAVTNGVQFRFNASVAGLSRRTQSSVDTNAPADKPVWQLTLASGEQLEARAVVNCAGAGAFALHNMVSANKLESRPRKGEYVLLRREFTTAFSHTIFQVPTRLGKGVLVSPTVEGNLIVGPTAQDVEDYQDVATSAAGIEQVLTAARKTYAQLRTQDIIARFAGVRPSGAAGDFVLGEPEDAPGFYDVCALDSPGLTAAPAIAVDMAPKIARALGARRKRNYLANRTQPPRLIEMTPAERAAAQQSDPRFGHLVCRCELVSEAEVLAAIHAPIPAITVVGVKRRCRAGTGICQGGFCGPYVAELIARELGIPLSEVCEAGPGSEVAPFMYGSIDSYVHKDSANRNQAEPARGGA